MKKIAILPIILLLMAGITYAKNYEVTKKAGDYTIFVSIDRNPLVVGDNNIAIAVKDASGKDVSDAKVKVEYSMPAMPGMPAMNYKTDATPKGTAYQAKMKLGMPGPWNVAVKTLRGGKTATMKFSVDAQ